MFEIPDKAEVKDFGFTVYDAESGYPVGGFYDDEDDAFILAQNGTLFEIWDGFWIGKRQGLEAKEVPKAGKYIIQFSDGRYMRY